MRVARGFWGACRERRKEERNWKRWEKKGMGERRGEENESFSSKQWVSIENEQHQENNWSWEHECELNVLRTSTFKIELFSQNWKWLKFKMETVMEVMSKSSKSERSFQIFP
jgi:hypothetical protein